jgi:hypothetical protein
VTLNFIVSLAVIAIARPVAGFAAAGAVAGADAADAGSAVFSD